MSLYTGVDAVKSAAISQSSTVFLFDGFKLQAGELKKSSDEPTKSWWNIETRPGSCAAVVGYLNAIASNPKASADVKPITLLVTPSSLLELASTLAALPKTESRPRILVQVACSEPNVAGEDPTYQRLPAVGKVLDAVARFSGPEPIVLLSGNAAELESNLAAMDELASKGHDVVHVWDAVALTREAATKSASTSAMEGVEASAETDSLESAVSSAINGASFFSYHGPASPRKLLVLPASLHSALAIPALTGSSSTDAVGILVARVLRPWSPKQLQAAIPESVKTVYVYTETGCKQTLYHDVLAAANGTDRRIRPIALPSDSTWSVRHWAAQFATWSGTEQSEVKPLLPADSKLAVFWSADTGKTAELAQNLASQFSGQTTSGVSPRLLTEYDNYSGKDFGMARASLQLTPEGSAASAHETPLAAVVEASAPNLLFISNPMSVLKSYAPLETIDLNTQIVFSSSAWLPEEYSEKLYPAATAALAQRAGDNKIWTLDTAKVATESGLIAAEGLIEEAAFWHLYMGGSSIQASEAASTITNWLSTSPAGGEWSRESLHKLVEATQRALVAVPKPLVAAPGEEDEADESALDPLPHHILSTSIVPNPFKSMDDPLPTAPKNWYLAAKQLMFPEAYGTETESLRPDLPEENFILTVTENRRLTPFDYDRNVFHLELSTEGTGLKYAVGEALGVHGWNDAAEVHEFLEWFGLDPDAQVSLPAREAAHTKSEVRSVFQIFQQNLDIFGKPGKSFFEALSKVATNREESRHLRFIGAAEGSATFKKWSEVDTVTFYDVLKAFPSAKKALGLAGLLREVPLIKPRHYSIASSQNFVGNSVHLLVVTVDWMTPAEVTRFGQCTRYLAGLQVGDKVMVSVKPSVMKLPPKESQPVIMAGLGTGAAPFRAFLQEREYQRNQGLEVGPMLYYFGSRYSSKEFLYGEEIQAWMQDGIITRAGLAFSRDTNKKVYIQHKIQEDGKMLADALDEGAFYLCGPTWPVPDVTEAFYKALMENRGLDLDGAKARIEELKEEEKFVLEVY